MTGGDKNTSVETTLAQLVAQLQDRLSQAAPPQDRAAIAPFLATLAAGRYHFEREDWHTLHSATVPGPASCRGEFLLRARGADNTALNPARAFQIINQCRAHALLDSVIVLSAVAQALREGGLPLSVNISARNAGDAAALESFHTLLDRHFRGLYAPRDITFEFLEDDPVHKPARAALERLKNLGYGLAIDDQSHAAWDAERLAQLGPYVDVVKIDGKTLEALRDNTLDLRAFHEFLGRIRCCAPQAEILCEWVASPAEARQIADIFPEIHLVQGRNLPPVKAGTRGPSL